MILPLFIASFKLLSDKMEPLEVQLFPISPCIDEHILDCV